MFQAKEPLPLTEDWREILSNYRYNIDILAFTPGTSRTDTARLQEESKRVIQYLRNWQ